MDSVNIFKINVTNPAPAVIKLISVDDPSTLSPLPSDLLPLSSYENLPD